MTRGQRVAESIERSVSGPMWHGPALTDLLENVSAADAAARSVAGAHTIWELVHHITAWAEIARTRLGPVKPPDPTAEQDWPPVTDTSVGAWRSAVERLKASHRELAAEVAEMADDALVARLPGRDHNAIAMLHGIVEHDAYHGGQIAILTKALSRAHG